jgi:hypothetical protein
MDILVLLSAILIFIFSRSCGVIFSSPVFSFSPFFASGLPSDFTGVVGGLCNSVSKGYIAERKQERKKKILKRKRKKKKRKKD